LPGASSTSYFTGLLSTEGLLSSSEALTSFISSGILLGTTGEGWSSLMLEVFEEGG